MTELDLLWRVAQHIVAAGLLAIWASVILTVMKGRRNKNKTF